VEECQVFNDSSRRVHKVELPAEPAQVEQALALLAEVGINDSTGIERARA